MAERFLTYDERRKMNRIISGLYKFTDGGARDRRAFLDSAGLERFIRGTDLSGPSDIVVPDLTGKLERYGELDERPTFHALGALLDAMLDLGDVSRDNKSFFAGLIVRYYLASDPIYIEELRSQYQIIDEPVREPIPQDKLNLPEIGAEIIEPEFDVTIQDDQALEQIINSEDNFLDINLFYGAIYSSYAVCLIEIPEGKPRGTGFLVAKDLILTNQHVMKNKEYPRRAVARFDYKLDAYSKRTNGRVIKFKPEFYHFSPKEELDYALVQLEEQPLVHMIPDGKLENTPIPEMVALGKHRGYLSLVDDFIIEHERINIIQHPNGDPLKVVLTQNYVVADMSDTRVQYVADTMKGSSGSPVLNQNWQVVALHHSGGPYPPESAKEELKKAFKRNTRVNEGIPMRAILKDLRDKGIDHYLPAS